MVDGVRAQVINAPTNSQHLRQFGRMGASKERPDMYQPASYKPDSYWATWSSHIANNANLAFGFGSDRIGNSRGSYGVSATDFISQALNSAHGGSWSNGEGKMFESDEEAFAAGVNYNNLHNSWDNTMHGSEYASTIAYIIIKDERPSSVVISQMLDAVNELQAATGLYASNNIAAFDYWKAVANFLRYSPIGWSGPNLFFMAEIIYADGGLSFVGAEYDKGGFFMLVGKDKGKFFPFTEQAGGASIEAGGGIEYGRVDITGNPETITKDMFYGKRIKGWGSYLIFGAGVAISKIDDGERTAISISVSVGLSVNPWLIPVSGGINWGVITE